MRWAMPTSGTRGQRRGRLPNAEGFAVRVSGDACHHGLLFLAGPGAQNSKGQVGCCATPRRILRQVQYQTKGRAGRDPEEAGYAKTLSKDCWENGNPCAVCPGVRSLDAGSPARFFHFVPKSSRLRLARLVAAVTSLAGKSCSGVEDGSCSLVSSRCRVEQSSWAMGRWCQPSRPYAQNAGASSTRRLHQTPSSIGLTPLLRFPGSSRRLAADRHATHAYSRQCLLSIGKRLFKLLHSKLSRPAGGCE